MEKTERTGAQRIADERQRQIEKEGYTLDHDLDHDEGMLAWAAACYAAPAEIYRRTDYMDGIRFTDAWPFAPQLDKRPRNKDDDLRTPTFEERLRLLEKAGALIAAEIDLMLSREQGR